MKILSTKAGSHHSMPESVTAMTVDGRPAVVCQALSTLLPSTPHSSWGLSASTGLLDRALVNLTSPLPWVQFAGRSGISPDGVCGSLIHATSDSPEGAAGHGNCPVCVAEPEPVLGSAVSAGHDAGRESTTAVDVGSLANGRTAGSGARVGDADLPGELLPPHAANIEAAVRMARLMSPTRSFELRPPVTGPTYTYHRAQAQTSVVDDIDGSRSPGAVMRIGSIDIVPVQDGAAAVPASMLIQATDEQWLPHRQFLNSDGKLPMEIGGFLLRGVGDRVALVDLGLGPLGTSLKMGRFMQSLEALGVSPAAVTDVLFTHLHFDHIGWAVTDEVATFPNATYRCSSEDWNYFVEPGGAPPNQLAAMLGAPTEAELLSPVVNRFEVWEEGTLMPGITVTAAPGHTPGSSVLVISSGDERALLIGDVAHCPVELLEPEWAALSDVDPELARHTREALAREYEGTDIPMAASHFEGMQFGRLLPAAGKRQWVFD
jgi:glyoxylase-like metal-dependent hydrolase (beta-lactamase superfamily II)